MHIPGLRFDVIRFSFFLCLLAFINPFEVLDLKENQNMRHKIQGYLRASERID